MKITTKIEFTQEEKNALNLVKNILWDLEDDGFSKNIFYNITNNFLEERASYKDTVAIIERLEDLGDIINNLIDYTERRGEKWKLKEIFVPQLNMN